MTTSPPTNFPHNLFERIILTIATCLTIVAATHSRANEPAVPRYASGQVDSSDPNYVDVALVLAVDVSSSIQTSERLFQRAAYAAALGDPRVANLALGGGAGRIAIAYMEWSGRNHQRVHVPMRVMSTAEELAQFAQDILSIPDNYGDPMYVQATAIGNALIAAEQEMSRLDVRARDYVIDISGDGVVNDGTSVSTVREELLALGLTVNGLPIEVSYQLPEYVDVAAQQVSQYYAECVIGGPGSFHVVARGFSDVRETLIMKLMLEMAQIPATQKRRIATAWNRYEEIARVVPATVLNLNPQREEIEPAMDCSSQESNSANAFQIVP